MSTSDASALRTILGKELLAAFACCFATANRLAALVHLAKLNEATEFEAAKQRNTFTIFFLSIGVAHESVAAIQGLSKQLRHARCSRTLASEDHRELLGIARRWRKRLAEQLRNKWAFHFDVEYFLAGVDAWAQPAEVPLNLVAPDNREVYFPFADDLMIVGAARSASPEVAEQSVDKFARELWADQNAFAARVYNSFCEALWELHEMPPNFDLQTDESPPSTKG